MTFGTTEFKYFTIISDKCHTMSWVDRTRAEIAFLYSHFSTIKYYKSMKIEKQNKYTIKRVVNGYYIAMFYS